MMQKKYFTDAEKLENKRRLARECVARSRAADPERHRQASRESMARSRRANPEMCVQDRQRLKAYRRVYDAKLRQLPHDLSAEDWRRALAHFGRSCVYCGAVGELEQEHFVPLCKGGGYTADNIVPACRPCNLEKRGADPLVWLRTRPGVLWTVTSYLWGVVVRRSCYLYAQRR